MNEISYTLSSALLLLLKLSAVPVAVATLVGLIVGIFQTVMQIQEQTLPFGLKLLTVFFAIYLLKDWFSAEAVNFAVTTFRMSFH